MHLPKLGRVLKWMVGIILVLLALPIVLVGVILIVANTDPGRRLIESETASLTGGMVRITGLAGRFPDALRVGQIQVSDAKGPYVTISGLILDWSPVRLVERTAQINRLQADRLDFSRLPVSESSTSSSSGSFALPVHVDLRHLQVDQAVVGAAVAGTAATLALDGDAELASLTEGSLHLDAQRLDSPGHYVVAGRITPTDIQTTIRAEEPAKGLISSIAHLPDLGAVTIQGSINGPKDALGAQVGINAGPLTASASGHG